MTTDTQPPKQIIDVQVVRHLRHGLVVEDASGYDGLVRERELSWNEEELNNWPAQFPVGMQAIAILMDDHEGEREFSLRLAKQDPWDKVEQNYSVGTWAWGVVVSPEPNRTYIELESGVEGILNKSELPDGVETDFQKLFWPGDHVAVQVKSVEWGRSLKDRYLRLSMKKIHAHRWQSESRRKPIGKSNNNDALRLPLQIIAELAPREVLLVEDDPEQADFLCRWFENAGQPVRVATTAVDAIAVCQEAPPEIVICDVNLPGGQDGLEVVHDILDRFPAVRCYIATDWTTSRRRRDAIVALEKRGARLLVKPLDSDILFQVLDDQSQTAEENGEHIDNLMTSAVAAGGSDLSEDLSSQTMLQQTIDELRQLTMASKVVLFEFDTFQRQVIVETESGPTPLDSNSVTGLRYSPVRDVAEDGRTARINSVQEKKRYAKYLTPLLPFGSCVGVPVPHEQEERHALFVFFTKSGSASDAAESQALLGARTIGAILDRQMARGEIAEMQRIATLGHLSQALVHETGHQLHIVYQALTELQMQCEQATKKRDATDFDIDRARWLLEETVGRARDLQRLHELFSRTHKTDEEELVRVELIAEQCLNLVERAAQRAKVQVHLHPPERMYITRIAQTAVQQILLNLLMNAVQQIEGTTTRGGAVHMRIRSAHTKTGPMIRIEIEDDGPGIHRRMWKRIFLPRVTTRGDGTGMGLPISRALIEKSGGRLFVDKSAMLWGTVMAAEFPIHL